MNIEAAISWLESETGFEKGAVVTKRALCQAAGVVHRLDLPKQGEHETNEEYDVKRRKADGNVLTFIERLRDRLLKDHNVDLQATRDSTESLRIDFGATHVKTRFKEAERDAKRAIKKGLTHLDNAKVETEAEAKDLSDRKALLGAKLTMLRKREIKF